MEFNDMFFEEDGYHGTSFDQTYRCYPASFIDKSQIENGDKVIMPPSALDRLASLHIDYPMLFELQNAAVERVSHCGVLEFIAEEGMIYMPCWMMENLLLQEGDLVQVKNATLPKDQEPPAENEPKFNPFTGVARRLDGKPSESQPRQVASSGSKDERVDASIGQASTSSSSSQSTNRQSQGKLVFGSHAKRTRETQKDNSKKAKQEPPKNEDPKFQAFTGKKYSLKD